MERRTYALVARRAVEGAGMTCAFCKVAAGQADAAVVFEDEATLAFLDHRPLFPGHVLLIPKAHHETLPDLPADLLAPLFANAQRLAAAMVSVLGAEGSFVAINNRVSQSVPHLHVHVVPRSKGDGLKGFFWPRVPYDDDEHRSRIARLLTDALAAELRG
jgi:histidine triad (HIT) family protein